MTRIKELLITLRNRVDLHIVNEHMSIDSDDLRLLLDKVDNQSGIIARLKEDAEKAFDWCDHLDECSFYFNPPDSCDCGYEKLAVSHHQLMAEIEEENK